MRRRDPHRRGGAGGGRGRRRLRALDEQLAANPQIERIEQELSPLGERLADRFDRPSGHRVASCARNPGCPRGFLAIESWNPRDVDGDRDRAGRLARAAAHRAGEAGRDVDADTGGGSRGEGPAGGLAAGHGCPDSARRRPGAGRGGARRDPGAAGSCRARADARRQRAGPDRPGQRQAADGLFVRDSPPIWRVSIPSSGSRAPVGAALATLVGSCAASLPSILIESASPERMLMLVGCSGGPGAARASCRPPKEPRARWRSRSISRWPRRSCWACWRRSGSTRTSRARPGSSWRSGRSRRWW